MKYYQLRLPSDLKIIGVKNGIMQVKLYEDKYMDKDLFRKMMGFFSGIKWWEREQVSNLNFQFIGQLLQGAKLTDFLSFGPSFIGCPFLIHKKVVEVLEKFKLQKYYLYPAFLYDKYERENNEYSLFYTPVQDYNIVDFEKSIFFRGSELIGKKHYSPSSAGLYFVFWRRN